jgi:hypothetical protein
MGARRKRECAKGYRFRGLRRTGGGIMGKWGKRASWAAATALAVGVTSGASAADLGGNCCADLEERIAELEATTARKGNRKVSLEISGWLNKTILFWDDSIRRDVYAGIDNDAAESRFRFTGSATISPDVTAGFVYEFGSHGSQTNEVDQTNGGDDRGFGAQRLRQANAWLESKRLGRVTLGFASQATDGIAEIDLSRTDVVAGSSVDSWIAGFRANANGALYSNVTMYEFFLGNFDGGRDQLIRYDSPTISGFRLSASVSGGTIYRTSVAGQLPPTGPESTEWDIALRYAGEWNGFRFASGIGYHEGQITDSNFGTAPGQIAGQQVANIIPNKKVVASSSVLHVPSGLFFSSASGWLKFDQGLPGGPPDAGIGGAELRFLYVKSGILANLLPVGQASIYGEYYRMEKEVDGVSAADPFILFPGVDHSSTMWGVGVVQHIDAAAMEIYAAYRFYDSPNIPGPAQVFEFGDFHMIQVGTRIRF